jgi:hypothetical protein
MRVLVAAVLTMAVAQLFDLATFVEMVRRIGPTAEANPVVTLAYDADGLPMVAVLKIVLVAFASASVAVLRAGIAHPRLAAGVVVMGILFGVLGGLSNAVAIGVL